MGRISQKKLTSVLILIFVIMKISPISANASVPNIHSEAAILIDSTTGEVLYEKNAGRQMYPASITKILTAIITIETQDLDDIVTVSENAIRAIGTRVYLLENEQITIAQLLQGLMVSSGNDAAIAIAEHIDGSVDAFAERMNQFARHRIGVSEKTNFSNPHGLFEEDHIVTAADMAKISAYAMKNETFRDLVGTHFVDWVGEGWETRLYNHHPLLRSNEKVIGIKNGFVSMSGFTLATAAEMDGTELIAVTLKTASRYEAQRDTLALLEYGFANYSTQWLSFDKEPLLLDYLYPDEVAVTSKLEEKIRYFIQDGTIFITGEDNREVKKIALEPRPILVLPRFSVNPERVLVIEEKERPRWIEWFRQLLPWL